MSALLQTINSAINTTYKSTYKSAFKSALYSSIERAFIVALFTAYRESNKTTFFSANGQTFIKTIEAAVV